jgi:hypothetical protein
VENGALFGPSWTALSDGGVKQTTTGERADGTKVNATYTAKYDGNDVHVTGNSQDDTITIKQVNANTLTDERKKTGGPYKATARTVVSNGRPCGACRSRQ